jgi:hypothetical protein
MMRRTLLLAEALLKSQDRENIAVQRPVSGIKPNSLCCEFGTIT